MEPITESPKNTFPELHNAPAGVYIEEELKVGGLNMSSDIYIGKNTKGEKIIFDIAKDPKFIRNIQAKHNYLNQEIPPQKSIANLFAKSKPQLVEDFNVSKKIRSYGLEGEYKDYNISTRFVKLDRDSISPEMLEQGQIVEKYVEGTKLSSPNLDIEVKRAVLFSYFDFISQLKLRGIEMPDVNIEDDLIIAIDKDNRQVYVVRIDTEPWNAGDYMGAERLAKSAAQILVDIPYFDVDSIYDLNKELLKTINSRKK